MDEDTVQTLAALLRAAEQKRVPVEPLSAAHPGMTVDDAYAVQQAMVRSRVEDGEHIVGWKVGLTSRAMQQMLGVNTPDYGPVLSLMVIPAGGSVRLSELIQPRVEAEIAFVLDSPLRGPGVGCREVAAATRGVGPAIEVIDSRIREWKISLADTVADLASSARVVLTDKVVPLGEWDPRLVGLVLSRNDEVVATGAGAAVLGDPLCAVAWAANVLGTRGVTLEPGQVIMPGALHRAVDVETGDVIEAEFDRLGSVSVAFSG